MVGSHTAVRLLAKVRDRRLGLQPRLYAGFVCDDSAAEVELLCYVGLNEPSFFPFLPWPSHRQKQLHLSLLLKARLLQLSVLWSSSLR